MSRRVEESALAWLFDLGEQTGAFRVQQHEGDQDCDWKLQIQSAAGGRSVPIRIEAKGRITPLEFLGIRQRFEQLASKEAVVVCSPFISPRVTEMCRENGFGYLDSAGNCHLEAPGLFLHIEGRKVNRPPRSAPDPFAPKSSRIIRVLLNDSQRGWQVQELAKEAAVSLGLASRVKRVLEEQAYVETRDGLVYARSPVPLLKEWKHRYEAPERRPMYVMDQPGQICSQIAAWAKACDGQYALTGFSGAWQTAPMVRHNVLMVYVHSSKRLASDELVDRLHAKRVESGANLLLWIPQDKYVFYRTRTFEAGVVVSPLQLYLDLSILAGRGEEAAEEVFQKDLLPTWST